MTTHCGMRDQPAFPSHADATDGMTLRHYLIGQALAGVACAATADPSSPPADSAAWAVRLADEVLRALDAEAREASARAKEVAEQVRAGEAAAQAEHLATLPKVDPRIEAMRARVQARRDRDRAEYERRQAVADAGPALVRRLEAALKPCAELHLVKPGHHVSGCWVYTWQGRDPRPFLSVKADFGELVKFETAGDFEAGDVCLTHAGQRVAFERAVDVALAAVERCLYADGVAGVEVPRLEAEIPF